MNATAALTVPAGSSAGGLVETFGNLQFAGKFVSLGNLTIHRGGQAVAQTPPAPGDFVDFVGITNNEALSGLTPASILDNSVANAGSAGFRRKASGGFYTGATTPSGPNGSLLGPVPATY
jgi:hypothetical protein